MPNRMDAAAAAQAIRDRITQPEAEDRHVEAFANKVADHLGLDRSARNISMIIHALHREDIVPHEIQEYPKYIQRDGTDPETDKPYAPVKVESEDDEHDMRASWDSGEPLPFVLSEYPKKVMVRGTDGYDHPVMARDLKEERELLGLDHNPVQSDTPTRESQARLQPVTDAELDQHEQLTGGAEQNVEAIKAVNEGAKAQPQEAMPPVEGGKHITESRPKSTTTLPPGTRPKLK